MFSDQTCQGKASLVVGGAGTVLRGLTFTQPRAPDGNAAGVRLEGGSLVVEDCAFDDTQAAVVSAGRPDATLVVRRATVRHVGVPGGTLAAVTVNAIAAVRVENSAFEDNLSEGGALRTTAPAFVSGSSFAYGGGSAAVLEASGPLAVEGSTFRLTGPRPAAMRALGDEVTVRGTTLDNRSGTSGLLVQDWGGNSPVLAGNTVGQTDTEWSSAGRMLNGAKGMAHAAIDTLRRVAGRVRRLLP